MLFVLLLFVIDVGVADDVDAADAFEADAAAVLYKSNICVLNSWFICIIVLIIFFNSTVFSILDESITFIIHDAPNFLLCRHKPVRLI